jgi:chemotaxis protein MotB
MRGSKSLGIELALPSQYSVRHHLKEETMRQTLIDRAMPLRAPALAILCAIAVGGCVSTGTHTKTLAELEATKKTAAQQAADLEALKKKSQAQTDQLQQQLAGLQQNLDQEASQRKAAEQRAAELAKERESLEARSSELQSRLDGLEKEKGQLNGELSNVRGQITDLEQKFTSGNASSQEEIAKLKKQASDLEANAARIAKEREQLREEQARLAAALDQERAAKEEEIKRLTRTQEELSKSLQDEISKGNITIQQVRDRLTINMVDRVLFDSGQAQVKPAGVKVLKQVSDILKTVTDKQIRIEGHTDNVPISSKLQDRFKTNWELSTARATTVVRYLIDQGSVDRQHLSAVGYADTQPLASNDSEEGRSSNRRIEIVLYPKDLKEIAGQVETSAAASK